MRGRTGAGAATLATLVVITAAGLATVGVLTRPRARATAGAGTASVAVGGVEAAAPPVVRPEPATTLPGGVDVPFTPERSSWAVVSNGISLEVRLHPATPVVGQPVRFSVAAGAETGCCWLGLSYGDGASAGPDDSRACDATTGRQAVVEHAYPKAGQWTFTLTAAAGDCTTPATSGAVSGVVQVVDNPGRALV